VARVERGPVLGRGVLERGRHLWRDLAASRGRRTGQEIGRQELEIAVRDVLAGHDRSGEGGRGIAKDGADVVGVPALGERVERRPDLSSAPTDHMAAQARDAVVE
jgi:hypothetical protein